jgi:hypothetical protein
LKSKIAQNKNFIENAGEFSDALCFECFGVKIKVCADERFSLAKIRALLPFYAREIGRDAAADFFCAVAMTEEKSTVYFNGEREYYFPPGEAFVEECLRLVLRNCVAENTAQVVFLHAGAAAFENKLVLLPGDGHAGKTTLTAELIKAGAIYFSDDMAIIDRRGFCHPYPKPLSMRRRKSNDDRQTDMDVSYFGGRQATEPLPVHLIAFAEFKPRAQWKPARLSSGAGLLELLKHARNLLKQPKICLEVLQKTAIQAKIIKSNRGEAERAAKEILRELNN